jgi:hypothetical protein
MHKRCNEFKIIIVNQDPNNGMENLKQNKQEHKNIRSVMTSVDDRSKYLIALFIIASIVGTFIPISQIWQLYRHDELSKRHEVTLPVIINASVYVLDYLL